MSAKVYRKDYWGDADKHLPNAIKNFFFIRHGQTDANVEKKAQGHRDNPLNAMGVQQARELNWKLNELKLPIKNIVSSPLQRAYRTALLAAVGMGLWIHNEELLKERSFGDYEGTVPPSTAMYFEDWDTCEPRQEFGRRVAKSLGNCCEEGTLLVAHGCVLRTIIGLLDIQLPGTEQEQILDLGNAQILSFDKTDAGWTVTNLSKDN